MNQQNQEQNEFRNHYFYKITNLINGKFYFGIRTTSLCPENDFTYMGSGKLIKAAIEKYGKENFTKEIIANYPTRQLVCEHERSVVTIELIDDPMCYNLRTGGEGGQGWHHTDDAKERIRNGRLGLKHTEESKRLMSENSKGVCFGENHGMFGKKRSEENIQKWRESYKNHIVSEETRQKRSQSRKGRKHSVETRERMKTTSSSKRSVIIDDVFYESLASASRALNLSKGAISNRVNSNLEMWKTWTNAKK